MGRWRYSRRNNGCWLLNFRLSFLHKIRLFLLFCFVIFSCTEDNGNEETWPSLDYQEPYIAGETYFGLNEYIEYQAGDLPIILAAPHGGALTPSDIPNRSYGTQSTDTNTEQLSRVIADTVEARFGKRPHVVICRLKRTKLDANRDSIEAAQDNEYALRAWQEFHHYIASAKEKITRDYGSGLYLDIHGHGANPDGFYDLRIWLGYLLSGNELDKSDSELNSDFYKNKSSIRHLAETTNESFIELLRGSNSFGTLLGNSGYESVPSLTSPGPQGSRFFSGGYNTRRHGSVEGGTISAIQLEMQKPGIRDNKTQLSVFAQEITTVLEQYFKIHYNKSLIQ